MSAHADGGDTSALKTPGKKQSHAGGSQAKGLASVYATPYCSSQQQSFANQHLTGPDRLGDSKQSKRFDNSCQRLQSLIEGRAGGGLSGLSGSKGSRTRGLIDTVKDDTVSKGTVFKPGINSTAMHATTGTTIKQSDLHLESAHQACTAFQAQPHPFYRHYPQEPFSGVDAAASQLTPLLINHSCKLSVDSTLRIGGRASGRPQVAVNQASQDSSQLAPWPTEPHYLSSKPE